MPLNILLKGNKKLEKRKSDTPMIQVKKQMKQFDKSVHNDKEEEEK